VRNTEIQPHYWTAAKGTAEIDFVIQLHGDVIPVEVKAAENLQAKSLKSYIDRYKPKHAVRTSMSNFREEDRMINIPLYAIGGLPAILTRM
jgi:predicted AAA+ superfamily ATPase